MILDTSVLPSMAPSRDSFVIGLKKARTRKGRTVAFHHRAPEKNGIWNRNKVTDVCLLR